MSFENPDLLHLLWALALQAILLFAYWQWRQHTLKRLGSPALEQRLLRGFSGRRFWIKNIMFALGLALVTLAVANPRRAVRVQPPAQNSADVLIALDISNSMLAKDVSPSRLAQAKSFIDKLVQALEGERIGLIFFAGDAYPQMPLSTDYEALLMFVRNANPDFITDQGTDLAAAIDLAARMFESTTAGGRAMIVISDGENHQANAMIKAREARTDGIVIHTVAVGTSGGGMIPSAGGGYQRDFTGEVIRTRVNETFLYELAQASGGTALKMESGAAAIESLKTEVGNLQKTILEAQTYTDYRSYFQWLLVGALLLLVWEQVLWWKSREKELKNDQG